MALFYSLLYQDEPDTTGFVPCIPHVELEEGKWWYLQDLCLYALNASVVEEIMSASLTKPFHFIFCGLHAMETNL